MKPTPNSFLFFSFFKNHLRIGLLVACLISVIFPVAAVAQSQFAESKIIASDGQMCDYFGWHMSLSGDDLIVGANHNQYGVIDGGFAYIFRHDSSGWIEQTKLIPGDNQQNDKFGFSVGMSGDHVLVGTIGDDDNGPASGSVYPYEYIDSAWTAQGKFYSSDINTGDFFGYDISISGDIALITSNTDDEKGSEAGAAYIFEYDGSAWVEQVKLTASDASDSAYFGNVVMLSGDYAAIGAWGDAQYGRESGAVYIFHHDSSGWVEQAKLQSGDIGPGDHFGRTVAIKGEYAIVGASRHDYLGNQCGAAYVFHHDGVSWMEQVKLLPSDGAARDHYGRFVLLSDEYAIVASTFDDVNGIMDAGSVYCYSGFNTPFPSPPTLVSPPDSATGVATSPTLSWNHSLGAGYYTVQLSDTVDFSRLAVAEDSITATSFAVAGLSLDTTYFWRVAAVNSAGTSSWSAVWSFRTTTESSPVVTGIPDQTVSPGIRFVVIRLDNHVDDPDNNDSEMTWSWSGDSSTTIRYDATRRRATVRYPNGWTGSDTITFTATDPNGNTGSDQAIFTVDTLGARNNAASLALTTELPTQLILNQNYPNPFNPSTTIRYGLPEDAHVHLEVYNLVGQRVANLVDREQQAGWHEVVFGDNTLASGLYFYRLQAGDFVEMRKLVLLK